MFTRTGQTFRARWLLGALGGALLLSAPSMGLAEDPSGSIHPVAMSQDNKGWAEKLKGQTIVENSVEGRAERAALVELQHQRLMQQMQKEMGHETSNTGAYNSMSMMHQYGAGPANGLLASTTGVEPVSGRGGAVSGYCTGKKI